MAALSHTARLRRIAERQRFLTAAFFAPLLLSLFTFASPLLGFVAAALAGAAVLVYVVKLMRALDKPDWVVVLAALGMLVPVLNLVILLVVNVQACSVLHAAGLRIGFLGVSEHELAKLDEESLYGPYE